MTEYSYFRAGGKALEAIKERERLKAESEALMKAFTSRHGGPVKEIHTGVLGDAMVVFDKDAVLPEGWSSGPRVGQDGEAVQAAWPRHGSEAERDIWRLISYSETHGHILLYPQRFLDRALLGTFNTLRFIKHGSSVPEKEASLAFVRTHDSKDAEGFREGTLRDSITRHGKYAADSYEAPEILDAVFMDGEWYLRARNDREGNPLFTPPDSTPVSFDRMLELDRQEHLRREALEQAKEMLAEAADTSPRAMRPEMPDRTGANPMAKPKPQGLA